MSCFYSQPQLEIYCHGYDTAFADADSNSLNKLKSSQEKLDEARKSIIDYLDDPL